MPNFGAESEAIASSLAERYVRLPYAVGADQRLSASDVRVYFALASAVWQGRTCTLGNERISAITGVSARQVRSSIRSLITAGHVQMAERKRGQRAIYALTSPVFGQKQGKVNVVRSTPRGKRLVSVEKTA